jgi:hypothetical protein
MQDSECEWNGDEVQHRDEVRLNLWHEENVLSFMNYVILKRNLCMQHAGNDDEAELEQELQPDTSTETVLTPHPRALRKRVRRTGLRNLQHVVSCFEIRLCAVFTPSREGLQADVFWRFVHAPWAECPTRSD